MTDNNTSSTNIPINWEKLFNNAHNSRIKINIITNLKLSRTDVILLQI